MRSNPRTTWAVAASVVCGEVEEKAMSTTLFQTVPSREHANFNQHISIISISSNINNQSSIYQTILKNSRVVTRHASTCLHELVLALDDSDLEVRRGASMALTNLGEAAAPEIVAGGLSCPILGTDMISYMMENWKTGKRHQV